MASRASNADPNTTTVPRGVIEYRRFARREPELVGELVSLRSEWRAHLSQLGGLSRRQQHSRVRKLLRSKQFALLQDTAIGVKAKQIGDATRASLENLAANLDPFKPCYEPMRQREVEKDGRTRTVDMFGPIKRARQQLVADIVRHTNPPRANQYMLRGGIPAALAAVEAAHRDGLTRLWSPTVSQLWNRLLRRGGSTIAVLCDGALVLGKRSSFATFTPAIG